MTMTRMAQIERQITQAYELVLEARLNQLRPGVWSAFNLIVRDPDLDLIAQREAELLKLRREPDIPSAIGVILLTLCALPVLGVWYLAEHAVTLVRGLL